MSFKRDQFDRIKEILFGALDRSEEDRAAYLDRECAGDAALRAEIDRKLARLVDDPGILRSTGIGAFLGSEAGPIGGDPARTIPDGGGTEASADRTIPSGERVSAPGEGAEIGSSIGPYRIVKLLGEGGMGVVYEAEQQHPRRHVALKLIRGGRFIDEASVRMFQREIDTLARLKHPNIGAIHESGRTDDGRHFFAMELVRGRTLGDYLHARNSKEGLKPSELALRLKLFAKIADAVGYAHQRGVIHRDLKPSNIFIVEDEASGSGSRTGVPEFKILDFGLARITDSDVAATMVSEVGVIKGTLTHMSPEQARGNPEEIDTRADVYSLGVILYEMLTGRLPSDIPSGSVMEALRVITEEPPRPLRDRARGRKPIDSDVETICFKALEKAPAARYQSAAALGDDVRRYLASEPIVARPPSTMYQIRKFAARNRPVVFGVLATVTVLILGAITSTTLAIRESKQRRAAEEAREQAERETARATEVQQFLQEMITSADPYQEKGPLTTMAEVLDAASEQIGEKFEDRPDVQGSLRFFIGRTYVGFARWQEAQEQLEMALPLLREAYPGDHFLVGECMRFLGECYERDGRPESIPMLREAVDMFTRMNGENDSTTAVAMHDLAFAYGVIGGRDPAVRDSFLTISEQIYRRTHEIFREIYGERHQGYARSMQAFAVTLWKQGRTEEAVALVEEAVGIVEDLEGQEVFLHSLYQDHGTMLVLSGEVDAGIAQTAKAIDAARAVWGEGSLQEFWVHRRIGNMQTANGLYGDATRSYETAAGFDPEKLDRYDREIREVLLKACDAYRSLGDPSRGAETGRRCLDLHFAAAEAEPDSAGPQIDAARAAIRVWPDALQRPDAALRFARRACELTENDDPDALRVLGEAQLRSGREREAVASFGRALEKTAPDDDNARKELQDLMEAAEAAKS